MTNSLKQTAQEIRPILADMVLASEYPSRRELKPGSPAVARLAHMAVSSGHAVVRQAGKLANYNYERKVPQWPFKSRSTSVLGWGQEKIAYRVTPETDQVGDIVVSVYHREAMGRDPLDVIHAKKEKYEAYKKYFGELIVPTSFAVIDNPWGDGGKPASIQPFLKNTERFSDYTADQLRAREADDPAFAESLQLLKDGYHRMLEDDLCPDFGGSNLVITEAGVRIFDTGLLLSADESTRLRALVPSYKLVEEINGPTTQK